MEKYQPILRRLKAAAQERDIRHKMTVEDEFLEEMERYERNYEESMRNVEAQRIKVEEEMRKAEAAKRELENIQQQKHKAVSLLLELGMSKKEIANKLDLSEEEMQQY